MNKSKKDLILLIVFTILAVSINVYIIYHSCLNGSQSGAASKGVTDFIMNIINGIRGNTINESNYDIFSNIIRKLVGHFGLFVISGLFSSLSIYYWLKDLKWYRFYFGIIISFAFGFLLASLTEIIQLNVPNRSGEFTDVLIDSSGYLLGLGIIVLILFLVIRHKTKHNQSNKESINE